MAMTREEVKVVLGVDSTAMTRGLNSARSKVAEFSQKASGYFKTMGANLVGALGVGTVMSATKAIVEYGGKLQDLSETAGVSTDFIQGFSSKVAQSGGSAAYAEKALEKLSLKIGEARSGVKTAVEAFAKWGIELKDSNGKAKTTEELVGDIAERMKNFKDPTIRAALAAEFFGAKLGQKLAPALAGGREELDKFIASANKMSPEDIKAMDDLSDTIAEMGRQAKVEGGQVLGFFAKLAEHLGGLENAPGLMMKIFNPVLNAAKEINKAMNKNPAEKPAAAPARAEGAIIPLSMEERTKAQEMIKAARDNKERARMIESLFNTRKQLGPDKIADLDRIKGAFDIEEARIEASGPMGKKQVEYNRKYKSFRDAESDAILAPRNIKLMQDSSIDLIKRGAELDLLRAEMVKMNEKLANSLRVEIKNID